MRLRPTLTIVTVLSALVLFIPAHASAQASSSDSETPKALLDEVRQLRRELLETTTTTQQIHILIYRLQEQRAAVNEASAGLDQARTKLAEAQSSSNRIANDIKQNEDFLNGNSDQATDRKGVENALTGLRAALPRLQAEEQQKCTRRNWRQRTNSAWSDLSWLKFKSSWSTLTPRSRKRASGQLRYETRGDLDFKLCFATPNRWN
jgi:chromosome segregation ATPase